MARELRTLGYEADFEVEIYSECKYHATKETFENSVKTLYKDVESWEIISGTDAQEIEDAGLIDDYHEYLILHLSNGETATYRNSYVDLWRAI